MLTDDNITIDGTYIQEIGHRDAVGKNVIDASDTIILPGFIEVHTHGGGSFNLHTTDMQEIFSYAR